MKGESEGYTVRSKEKDIAISNYPLLQTEFLYASKKGKPNTAVIRQINSKSHALSQNKHEINGYIDFGDG